MGAESDGIVPDHEHPHALTTVDMECFLSVILDLVGKSFTLKDKWKKIIEFAKRESSNSSFFTSVQPMIGFSKG